MKFGFFFDYDQTYTFVKLFNALARRIPGARASGFVVSDRYWAHAVKHLPPGSRLIGFYELLAKARRHRPTPAELSAFRAFDERHRLARVAYSDRHLNDWRYEELIPHYIFLIGAFRDYVETEKPDVFIFDAVASQHSHLLYLVLKDMGVKILMPMRFGVEDLNHLNDNAYLECPEVWSLYRAMQEKREAPSPDERAWAEKFIAQIRSGQPAYVNQAISLEARKFSLPKISRVVTYARNYLLYDRNDPHQQNPFARLWSIIRLRVNRRRARRYLRDARDLDGDFILFALHYEPEIATLILSQYDQLSAVDLIARQLPLSCRLVLKEHPAMDGQRPWTFYRDALRKYPNLIFLSADASLNKLMRKARGLVTLSGTPILESLILRCPVIYTSRSRFGGFGLGVFTQNLIEFGKALTAAENSVTDDDALIQMLSAIRRSCWRFEFMEPLGNPVTLTDGNIEKIATAILNAIARSTTSAERESCAS